MNQNRNVFFQMNLAALGLSALIQAVGAQPFTYQNDDLALGFRKTGNYQENYEVVVDIGQASNYVNSAIGASFAVPHVSSSQLTPDSFTTLSNLSWSVVGFYQGANYSGYPRYTLWVTVPRSSTNVPSAAPTRLTYGAQQTIHTPILSIFAGAAYLSSEIGTSNQDNNATFVREPIDNVHNLSVFMGGTFDNTQGTLEDNWPEGNLEITTPGNFNSGGVVSDLYEVRPSTDAQGNPIVDPHTGTNGLAYYVGYFRLNSNGTMTFTRDIASSQSLPPPPPFLSIRRVGNTSTISFGTTNGGTYTLYYTNAAGLTQPVANWPASVTTITGDGNTNSFTDSSSDPMRIYRVGGH
jgi:hypothetical protein